MRNRPFKQAYVSILLAAAASGTAHAAPFSDALKRAEPALARMANDRVVTAETGEARGTRTHFSGVVISEEGHVLTALHSLGDSYPRLFALGPNYHGQAWVEARKDAAGGILEGISLWIEGRDTPLRAPRPVLLGGGTFIREPAEREKYEPIQYRSFHDVRTRFGDFAVVKFDFGVEKAPCVPSSFTAPEVGEAIWAWGYRPVKLGPEGRSVRHYASGKVLGVSSLYAMKILNEDVLDSFPQFHTFLSEAMFLSDADTRAGMSGGMFVDEEGRLVGVIDGGLQNGVKKGTTQVGFGTTIEHVFDHAVARLGAAEAWRLFRCPAPDHRTPVL